MKYLKPPLSYEQQADTLLSRGMTGDRAQMIERLSAVSYYRLSGYWHPFRKKEESGKLTDYFREGTSFDAVWNRYAFDRRLRVTVMDAVERVEIAIRAWLAYQHSQAHGPFGYVDNPASLSGLSEKSRHQFLADIAKIMEGSKETFVKHFDTKYGDEHDYMPIWMASEIMTFGQVISLYDGASAQIKRNVAAKLRIPDKCLRSWLIALNAVRNVCAHHGRLWNRRLGVMPIIPTSNNDWIVPVRVKQEQMFGMLTILKYCLDHIAPQTNWVHRFLDLLDEFPNVPIKFMGFPDEWRKCPIWSEAAERLEKQNLVIAGTHATPLAGECQTSQSVGISSNA